MSRGASLSMPVQSCSTISMGSKLCQRWETGLQMGIAVTHRSLNELIDHVDPAWPVVQEWLAAARNPIEVLPARREEAERTLLKLQVTTHSVLGAVALETGGMLIDHGWLRLLGSGHDRMRNT